MFLARFPSRIDSSRKVLNTPFWIFESRLHRTPNHRLDLVDLQVRAVAVLLWRIVSLALAVVVDHAIFFPNPI